MVLARPADNLFAVRASPQVDGLQLFFRDSLKLTNMLRLDMAHELSSRLRFGTDWAQLLFSKCWSRHPAAKSRKNATTATN